MNQSSGRMPAEWEPWEQQIAAELHQEAGVWSPACLDPDDLIGLIEQGGTYPEAAALLRHLAACPYCRREYGAMRQTLSLAAEMRGAETPTLPPVVGPPTSFRTNRPAFLTRLAGAAGGAAVAACLFAAVVIPAQRAPHARIASQERDLRAAQQENHRMAAALESRDAQLQRTRQRSETDLRQSRRAEAAVQRETHQASAAQAARLGAENTRLAAENARLQAALPKPPARPAAATPLWDGSVLAAVSASTSQVVALVTPAEGLRGGAPDGPPAMKLLGPAATLTLADRPTLRWEPAPGAGIYRVTLTDSEDHVLGGATLSGTTWTAPRPLPRGRVYRWQVEALQGDREVARSPEAVFGVAPAKTVAALAKARMGDLHLQMGGLYLQAHLLDEAERELNAILPADPEYPAAGVLLRRVQIARRR